MLPLSVHPCHAPAVERDVTWSDRRCHASAREAEAVRGGGVPDEDSWLVWTDVMEYENSCSDAKHDRGLAGAAEEGTTRTDAGRRPVILWRGGVRTV